jgi:hypothetical protein
VLLLLLLLLLLLPPPPLLLRSPLARSLTPAPLPS